MIRLGLIGYGRIAELAVCRPARGMDGVEVAAVVGRDRERVQAFAETHAIPHAFGTVEELLDADVVDAVYVALPHHLHAQATLAALSRSRHVLVEKPLALTADDAESIQRAGEAAGRVVVEAVMVQHHPWQQALRQLVDECGPVRSIETRICFPLPPERIARLRGPAFGGGVFCDVAPYWLQFLQTVTGLDVASIEARGSFDGPDAADLEFSARLGLDAGITATLFASYREPLAATHTLHCADGTITIPDFLRPMLGDYQLRIVVQRGEERRVQGLAGGGYYENQLRSFAARVEDEDPPPLTDSVERIRLMERVYRQAQTETSRGAAGEQR